MTCLANDFYLQHRCLAAGPKQAMRAAAALFGQPGHQRRLRADHHQGGGDRAGQRGHRLDVGQVHRHGWPVIAAMPGSPGAARRSLTSASAASARASACPRPPRQKKDSHGASLTWGRPG